MIALVLGLALAAPGELRAQRLEALDFLAEGGVPALLVPRRGGDALARRYVDEQGRIYARGEVLDLLEQADPSRMQRYWRQRHQAHDWATVMVMIPPPWGFGALIAHTKRRARAARELDGALCTYNERSTGAQERW